MHRLLLHNGAIRDTRERLLAPGQVGFLNGWGVFSTIRVRDGVLFAFLRHYARMADDARRMRVPFPWSASELESMLLTLVDANEALNATLRVAVVRNRGGLFEMPEQTQDADVIAFTTDLTRWNPTVRLGYVAHGRHAASPFAGAKITSWAQNLTWNEEARAQGLDEVILLNEHGQVSECTSANLFAVFGSSVVTPPVATSGCLAGVTRALLLEEIRVPGLEMIERDLLPDDLNEADQVFITSTTRDLLQAAQIGAILLQGNDTVFRAVQTAFLAYQEQYVRRFSRVPVPSGA